jgi:hypothetical protein
MRRSRTLSGPLALVGLSLLFFSASGRSQESEADFTLSAPEALALFKVTNDFRDSLSRADGSADDAYTEEISHYNVVVTRKGSQLEVRFELVSPKELVKTLPDGSKEITLILGTDWRYLVEVESQAIVEKVRER